MSNVNLNNHKDYKIVCVWPGTLLGEHEVAEFEQWFLDTFKTRIQFLETIITNPTPGSTDEIGGRSDVLFAVHDADLGHFAVPRLEYGIRWLSDVYFNNQGYLYPARVEAYCE